MNFRPTQLKNIDLLIEGNDGRTLELIHVKQADKYLIRFNGTTQFMRSWLKAAGTAWRLSALIKEQETLRIKLENNEYNNKKRRPNR